MNASPPSPVTTDVVLIGGGHAHVIVLKALGMRPLPGVRVTLITRDMHTPYSGMLPGYIAGHYTLDECHIDLRPLVAFASARLVHAEADGVDMETRRVRLRGRTSINFDVLSIDVGSTPTTVHTDGGTLDRIVPVKPIDSFWRRWEAMLERHSMVEGGWQGRIVVVGGGAGGIELAFAMDHKLNFQGKQAKISLYSRGEILKTHGVHVQTIMRRILKERGIELHENVGVRAFKGERLAREGDGTEIIFDECFWCTEAQGPRWLAESGIALDESNCIIVNDFLQSTSHANVFAAGDCSVSMNHPRPKAGVFAVRAGMPLAENLRRHVMGRPLLTHTPQTTFLSLISTGNKYAIASKGGWAFEGKWLWTLKDYIDRGFMAKFGEKLPKMKEEGPPPDLSSLAQISGRPEALAALAASHMRCGGCGAKVGANVLRRVMQRLGETPSRDEVLVGLNSPDDAAVVRMPHKEVTVQTVDFFRSFISDAYVFGRIAANHALSDCHAMNAVPITAMAIAMVPFGLESKVEEDLYQMMAGACSILKEEECAIVGGHSCEGQELGLGFAIVGSAPEAELLLKGGMKEGDRLILTKALGTGTLFAADMRGKAKGRWIEGALNSMQQSSRRAATLLREVGATSCTDVTGFGLVGHIYEMAKSSMVNVQIDMAAIHFLEGAIDCVQEEIYSSLHPQNVRLARSVANVKEASKHPAYPLLFDPQTAGGLCASVASEKAEHCIGLLRENGYTSSAIIGTVLKPVPPYPPDACPPLPTISVVV